jgi:cytochrome c oxidase subunit 4
MSSQSAHSHATGHGAGHQAHDAHDIKAHVKTYMMVFGALAVLTVVTVAVSYIHLPTLPAVALGLLIATVKASLVAMFFMHLKGEKRSIVWTLILTAIFFVALMTIPYSWWLDGPMHREGTGPTARSITTQEGHSAPHSPAAQPAPEDPAPSDAAAPPAEH